MTQRFLLIDGDEGWSVLDDQTGWVWQHFRTRRAAEQFVEIISEWIEAPGYPWVCEHFDALVDSE